MWHWHDGPDGWGALWMLISMAVLWVPLLLLLAWGVRRTRRPSARDTGDSVPPRPEPDAREIARHTYARGEIDRERYLQIIEDLDRTAG